MAGTPKRLAGPLALTTTLTTNLFNQSSALIITDVKQMHFVNKTGGAVTVTMYLGATGANVSGTELFLSFPIPANDVYDAFFSNLVLTSADFLVGGAGANTSITLTILGDQRAA